MLALEGNQTMVVWVLFMQEVGYQLPYNSLKSKWHN
jgi:hypothetical protein